jgi:glycosyltransferase involved in cell wall biosynthesis
MTSGTPLRIVHCFRSPVGGIFRHVRDLAAAQAEAGHQIGIVCDSSTGGKLEDHLFNEIRGSLALGLTRMPIERRIGVSDIGAAWRAFSAIRKLRPDVIHGHGAKGGVYSRMFGSLLRVSGSRVARLYSPHGGSLHYDAETLKGRMIFAAERGLEHLTDTIIFVSAFEREVYTAKVGPPRCRSTLVHNGLNPRDFERIPPNADAADFLFIGMMRDLKGPDIFIDAIAKAEAWTGLHTSAVLIGDGPDRDRYIAQAARLGLSDRVRFLMPMPARDAFRLGRCVVVSSRAEAMPYIVLETLAAGRSIIATRVGGIPEALGERSPALVPPDSEAVAQNMLTFLDSPAGYSEFMPSREELERRFSAAAMATSIEDAYRQALA